MKALLVSLSVVLFSSVSFAAEDYFQDVFLKVSSQGNSEIVNCVTDKVFKVVYPEYELFDISSASIIELTGIDKNRIASVVSLGKDTVSGEYREFKTMFYSKDSVKKWTYVGSDSSITPFSPMVDTTVLVLSENDQVYLDVSECK